MPDPYLRPVQEVEVCDEKENRYEEKHIVPKEVLVPPSAEVCPKGKEEKQLNGQRGLKENGDEVVAFERLAAQSAQEEVQLVTLGIVA